MGLSVHFFALLDDIGVVSLPDSRGKDQGVEPRGSKTTGV